MILKDINISPQPAIAAPLDPRFLPAVVFNRHYVAMLKAAGKGVPLVLGLERENGLVSRYETLVRSEPDAETLRYVEQTVKFLLWARGGWKLHFDGPKTVGEFIRKAYSNRGARKFDCEMMTRAYGKNFQVVLASAGKVPAHKEMQSAAGGHLKGCRIGFDLGASDYKVSAVMDGEVIFTEEMPWQPAIQPNPEYHYHHLSAALHRAASHLPRVDAIGGSSAGIVVDNEIRVASILRAIPKKLFPKAAGIFKRVQREWNIPVVVMNDGDVTALAGALSLRQKGMLGIAMGSSQAVGFMDLQGRIPGWLNELAFAPVDYNPVAVADEWSGDRGVGAFYFSQQAVNKLLPAASIFLPKKMGLPERLKEVQNLMAKGDVRAAKIYETIGVYFGYAIAHYADFYDFRHLLIPGRVTTGQGGDVLLAKARGVLRKEFPEVAARIALHVPDEKNRRIGQAVAAACPVSNINKHKNMKLHQPSAEIFVPDGKPVAEALARITHLGIGAHQDDLKFMAFHGILNCFASAKNCFGGVICTNGSGSARTGPYADFTDAQMMEVRRREQNAAAMIGRYGVMLQLDHPSSVVKSPTDIGLTKDLRKILTATRPEVVYMHNPADKHDTHIGVVIAALQAMRELPREQRPQRVWGCEVWRALDWLPDADKVIMDMSGRDNLAAALDGVFDSQIAGGKRYDLATAGRRAANATFFESHATDKTTQLIFGMDLTPLVVDENADIANYVCDFIGKFQADVRQKLIRRLGRP